MPKFRKKPVVIEARQHDGSSQRETELLEWMGEKARSDQLSTGIIIQTLEGTLFASVGDWIIKGVEGEYYPCKPTIFAKTYDPVE